MESPESESSPEGHQRTRWSRIAERDFAHFHERYAGPVRRFLSARLPAEVDAPSTAADLTQELFLRFHEKDFLGRADQERGPHGLGRREAPLDDCAPQAANPSLTAWT